MLSLAPSLTVFAQTTPEESAETELEPDAIVDTGVAAAISDLNNVDNTNKINTDQPTTEEAGTSTPATETAGEAGGEDEVEETEDTASSTTADENASTTPLTLETDITSSTASTSDTNTSPENAETKTASTTPLTLETDITSSTASTSDTSTLIELDNQATSTTNATTSASTGDNVATGDGPSAIITGDAYAYSNVVNLTNTNIINSNGFIAFLNLLFGQGDVDLRGLFDVFDENSTTTSCDTDGCESQQLETTIANEAAIDNNINVVADTGNNHASGSEAAILTGDAYAVANVTNIANTNIVDANYLMLTFSNFGDLFGDVVLPGKYLLDKLFQSTGAGAPLTINTDNNANIENNVSATADTGENTASSTTGGTILTGDAVTYNNVYNQVNTNAINSDSFTMLFRVHGDWDGEIYGLPDGLSWQHTADGIAITNTGGETTASQGGITAALTNSADITNNVSATALTGQNHTEGEDMSYVETGDAYAAANVTNIANTNILGRNWGLLIFDIFGDWQGDIAFGQPDLWIGGTANIQGTAGAGGEILYTFTVSNLGDTEATGVKLNGNLNSDIIRLTSPMQNISLGTINPGETVERTFPARVIKPLPSGTYPVDLTAQLTSDRPDKNLTNNEEVVTVIAEQRANRGGGSGRKASDITRMAELEVTKTANQTTISPGDTVEYEISITNSGGAVFDGILYDTLYDETGTVILDKNWPLNTIPTNETITVTYEIEFAEDSSPGTYTNSAQVLGYHKNRLDKFMEEYDSDIARVPITITGAKPSVLGLTTSLPTNSCEPYLTSFLKAGAPNNFNQVLRLQLFLNNFTEHSVSTSGVFDPSTETAVRNFQAEHRTTVLDPWGLNTPTGYVYYTTQKRINEIYCRNTALFPLNVAQTTEINRYRFAATSQPTAVAKVTTAPVTPEPEPATTPAVALQPTPKKSLFPLSKELPELDIINRPNMSSTPNQISDTLNRGGFLLNFTNWIKNSSLRVLKIW